MPELSARQAARAAVGCALALMLLTLAVELVPRLTEQTHAITATPVPTGMRVPADVPLEPGQRACMDGIVVSPDSGRIALHVDETRPLPTPPLDVTLSAPGYERTARAPAGDEHALQLPIAAPPRTVTARLCVRNRGTEATALAATADPRVLARTRATVDGGYPLAAAYLVTFTAGETTSPLSRLSTTVARAAAFNALGPWAVWLFAGLVALAVPFLLLRSFYLAARDDERAPDAERTSTS
jgi:hypothetical protein